MNMSRLKDQVNKLPAGPGIYLFKGPQNKPLYIGKALNLKNRVKSYIKTDDNRLQRMILEAKSLDFMETGSEIEALILESRYIKKYRPAFNIVLRDDKQYSFVGFTEEEYPKIFTTHQPQAYEEVIGPFTDAGALKTTLNLLRRIFPYCTCKQTHHNFCLNYHIGKCPGYCCLKKPETDDIKLITYKKNIKAVKDILSGKKEQVIRGFEKEMKELGEKGEYEKALELQYKISKLKRIFENARIIRNSQSVIDNSANNKILENLKNILKLPGLPVRIECYDVANIQGKFAVGAMAVFIDGKPDKNEYRKFKIYTRHTPDDTAMLREILVRRFNHPEWTHPNLILVDGGRPQFNAAKSIVKNIPVVALTKNERHLGYKIITGKNEVSLSKLPVNLKNLLLQIDSEAHRFAISYYRATHRKGLKSYP